MHCLAPVLRYRQRGASALEFALVFPLFFFLFYGLVSWGLIFTLQQNMSFAAQTAARAALEADPSTSIDYSAYEDEVETLVRAEATAALAWMPAGWKEKLNIAVEIESDAAVSRVNVNIRYPDYDTHPILRSLTFGAATFPPLPKQLVGQATLRL